MRSRIVLATALAAAVAAGLPAHAASHNSGGGSVACADGTVTWTPGTLWAPNHKLQIITIGYSAPADLPGDTTTITVGAIADDQAATDGTDETVGSGQPTTQQGLDWSGSGNTATSSEGTTATTTAKVRAERSGTVQAGRTYTIQVMCSEANNGVPDPTGSGTATLTVFVPHDQGTNT